jgi:hypothetical protein
LTWIKAEGAGCRYCCRTPSLKPSEQADAMQQTVTLDADLQADLFDAGRRIGQLHRPGDTDLQYSRVL